MESVETIITDRNRFQFDAAVVILSDHVLEGIASGSDATGYSAILRHPVDSEGNSTIVVDLGDFGSLRAAKMAVRKYAYRNKGEIQWIL